LSITTKETVDVNMYNTYVRCFWEKISVRHIFEYSTETINCCLPLAEISERFYYKHKCMCGTCDHLDALIAFSQLIVIHPLGSIGIYSTYGILILGCLRVLIV